MKQPNRQIVFNAMAAIDQGAWTDLLEKLLPIVRGQALVFHTPAVERLRAVVSAVLSGHDQNDRDDDCNAIDYSSDEWRAVGLRLDTLAMDGETRVETLLRILKDVCPNT